MHTVSYRMPKKINPVLCRGKSHRLYHNCSYNCSILIVLNRYTENNRKSILSPESPLIRLTMYTVYSIQYTVYYTVYDVQYTVYCIQYRT
jgi:hypothetical protein